MHPVPIGRHKREREREREREGGREREIHRDMYIERERERQREGERGGEREICTYNRYIDERCKGEKIKRHKTVGLGFRV